jgi:hypothetical protein
LRAAGEAQRFSILTRIKLTEMTSDSLLAMRETNAAS